MRLTALVLNHSLENLPAWCKNQSVPLFGMHRTLNSSTRARVEMVIGKRVKHDFKHEHVCG